jgi:glycosyltransferase involved in cell wall biosynthesis
MQKENKKIVWQSHESMVSGANIALLEYIDALSNAFDFFVILPHQGSMQAALEKRGIAYAIVYQYGWTNRYPWWNVGKWMKVLLRSITAILKTIHLINKEKPSIVCTNTLVPFTASIAAKLKSIPHVWWIHEFGKEDFGFSTGWGLEKTSFWWMQQSSKLIIGNSNAIKTKFSKLMPRAKVLFIYQPVSWNAIHLGEESKHARFLMFGQIVESKGHKDVLNALLFNKKNGRPLYTLHIKGPNEIKSYLTELQYFIKVNELQEYVKIEVGYFKKEEVLPHYEILIAAAKSEAFGRVIVEANKAGLRSLVRNNGGAPELINESNGLLFSNLIELSEQLSSESIFINNPIRLNYNEDEQIQQLKHLLYSICR